MLLCSSALPRCTRAHTPVHTSYAHSHRRACVDKCMHTRVHAVSVSHLYLPESLFLRQKQWIARALPPAAAETLPQLKCTWPAKPLGDKGFRNPRLSGTCFCARPGSVWVVTRGRSGPAFAHSRPLKGWSRWAGDISYHLFHFMLFLDTRPYSPRGFKVLF